MSRWSQWIIVETYFAALQIKGTVYDQLSVLCGYFIEIIEQDDLIKKEIEKGIIPDPNQPIDPAKWIRET
mgnify:CR=1 FL=1